MEAELEKAEKRRFPGENAFALYDTYGFPLDLTKEILEKRADGGRGRLPRLHGKAAYPGQKRQSGDQLHGSGRHRYDELPVDLTTEFDGYETLREEAEITALTTESEVSEALSDGQRGTIITDRTPFYATMGGQEGDRGVISCAGGEFVVEDAIHLRGGKVGHVGYVSSGMLKVGDKVTLSVDDCTRRNTEKNHSATHLPAEGAENGAGKPCRAEGLSGNAGPSPVWTLPIPRP